MADTGNRPARQIGLDARALDDIARMLRDPEWGVGMLEDIDEIVRGTGRSTETQIDEAEGEPISTWERH